MTMTDSPTPVLLLTRTVKLVLAKASGLGQDEGPAGHHVGQEEPIFMDQLVAEFHAPSFAIADIREEGHPVTTKMCDDVCRLSSRIIKSGVLAELNHLPTGEPGEKAIRCKKYMGWTTFRALHEEYLMWFNSLAGPDTTALDTTRPSCVSTFRKVVKSWSKYIGFRKESQHARWAFDAEAFYRFLLSIHAALWILTLFFSLSLSIRCANCADFGERIKKCQLAAERDAIVEAHRQHLRVVHNYRAAQTRYNHLSEESCGCLHSSACLAGDNSILKIDIDYCDQAKFRVPRNLALTKATENLWRPQLHTAGILMWGDPCSQEYSMAITSRNKPQMPQTVSALLLPKVAECYIICEADLPKGSASEISLLLRGLDVAADVLSKRCIPRLPEHLVIEALTTMCLPCSCAVMVVLISILCSLPALPDRQYLSRRQKPEYVGVRRGLGLQEKAPCIGVGHVTGRVAFLFVFCCMRSSGSRAYRIFTVR